MERKCPACDAFLLIRDGEKKGDFAKRKTCNEECAAKLKENQNQRINRKIYRSRFGATVLLTAGQYLAESMCNRQARKLGIVLPDKFWGMDQWKSIFFLQLKAANALLRKYDAEAIIAAMRSPRGKNCYSLSATWVVPLIHVEQGKLIREAARVALHPEAPKQEATIVAEKPREAYATQKSPLSALKGL